MKPRYKWEPLRQSFTGTRPDEIVTSTMAFYGITREEAVAKLDEHERGCTVWVNHTYQVQRKQLENGLVHLNIRRRDGGPIMRDWRHFQQIKNELVGPECEAVELYPAESRLVDTANKYHLYCVNDPTFRFPFGMETRDVGYETGVAPGLRQRPL